MIPTLYYITSIKQYDFYIDKAKKRQFETEG